MDFGPKQALVHGANNDGFEPNFATCSIALDNTLGRRVGRLLQVGTSGGNADKVRFRRGCANDPFRKSRQIPSYPPVPQPLEV